MLVSEIQEYQVSPHFDVLLTLLGAAGVNYIIGVPGADDVMLNYQSTSFHDALYLRRVLGSRPIRSSSSGWLATAFIAWRRKRNIPRGCSQEREPESQAEDTHFPPVEQALPR